MLTPLLTDTRHDVQSPLGFSYPRPSLFICFGLWYPHRKVEKVVIHLFTFKEDWASHAFNEEWFEKYMSWFVDTKLAAAELIGQLLLQGAQFLPFAPQIQPLTPPGLGKRSAESNLEEILERSAAMDCGKLLVCALAGDETNLSRDEMTILNLFSSDLPLHSGSVRCVMSVVSISIMIIISFLVFTDVSFTWVYSKIEFSLIKMYTSLFPDPSTRLPPTSGACPSPRRCAGSCTPGVSWRSPSSGTWSGGDSDHLNDNAQ